MFKLWFFWIRAAWNIIYSQLAAIDNVVLGGHDEEVCFTVSAENFEFAGIASS